MQTEIEAKFLDVNHDEIRKKLKVLGAKLEQPMRLMRRVLFDYPDSRFQKNKEEKPRLRVRDEGDKVTLSFKKKSDTNYDFEAETIVNSFEDTLVVLKAAGLKDISFQESKRETWKYESTEIVLDEWPWLEPYIEIEGPDEGSIKSTAQKLGLDWQDAQFGSVDRIYRTIYPGMKKTESVSDIPEVRFDLPVPKYFVDRR